MKKIWITLIMGVFIFTNVNAQKDTAAYIEVNGYAEKEISPDNIIVSFELSEYNVETKESTPIAQQEDSLLNMLKELEINVKDLKFDNFGKDRVYKKKTVDMYDSKYYLLKMMDMQKLMLFYSRLKSLNVTNFSIDELKNTMIETYKKELYAAAMKDAKDKAEILLSVVKKKVGNPIIIKEDVSSYDYDAVKIDNSSKREIMRAGDYGGKDISLGNLRLKYKICVRFAIFN